MICSAFPKPNISIPDERLLRSNISAILNPRSKFNKVPLITKTYNLKPSELIFVSSKKSGMVTKASDGATVMLTSGASGRINALLSLRALRSMLRLISAFFFILLLPFRGRRRCMAAGPGPESPEKGGGKEDKASPTSGKVVRVPAAMVPTKSVAAVVDKDVAARRALAIKMVVEGNGLGDNEDTVREYSLFITTRGDTMFTQSWTPVKVQVRGLVVLLHGLNEHSGRYDVFAKKLNANGFKVYGMDWIEQRNTFFIFLTFAISCFLLHAHYFVAIQQRRQKKITSKGHGGSDGLHAYVHSLDDAVNDMKLFLGKVLAENPGFPCFCFGHSTGGAIILKAVLDPKVRQRVAGIVLTSPAIGVQPSHPIFAVLAPVFSFLFPRFQFSAANKRGIAVSRDPDALVAKYSDPLVFTGAIRVRTGYEILRITAYLQQNLSRLTVPFLVLHGTDDSVTDPEASQKLYNEASSSDKNIKLYEGLLHDLLFEPEKEEIMEDIMAWLNSRL